MTTNIAQFKPGDEAVITGYNKCSSSLRDKILAMGLTRGEAIKVVNFAPLGDPVNILIRGYNLSLRKAEAEILILEKTK